MFLKKPKSAFLNIKYCSTFWRLDLNFYFYSISLTYIHFRLLDCSLCSDAYSQLKIKNIFYLFVINNIINNLCALLRCPFNRQNDKEMTLPSAWATLFPRCKMEITSFWRTCEMEAWLDGVKDEMKGVLGMLFYYNRTGVSIVIIDILTCHDFFENSLTFTRSLDIIYIYILIYISHAPK